MVAEKQQAAIFHGNEGARRPVGFIHFSFI
jgi:hypothetical protein